MADPTSNPFASPEIEETASTEVGPIVSIGMGRWAGLSTLSGVLLFAAYFAIGVALCMVVYIYFAARFNFWGTLQAAITPIAIYCLAAGVYGACIGGVVGLSLGLLSYFLRNRKPFSLLVYLGIPASLLLTVVSMIVLVQGLDPRSAEEVLTLSAIVATLGSILAGTHLVFNINRFLLKPHAAQMSAEA